MRRIIAGIDDSEGSDRAVEWAARVAAAQHAELVVVTVVAPRRPEEGTEQWQAELHRTHDLLDGRWSAPARAVGAHPRTRVLIGDTPDALLDAGDRLDADLIVIGTRHHVGFAGIRLGSFADWTAHRTNRPLAVVPAIARADAVGRIILGLDGRDTDQWAMGLCSQLARQTDADVFAVHAYRPSRWRTRAALSAPNEIVSKLEAWTAPIQAEGVRIHLRPVADSHAADALLRVADDEDADLIVIATRPLGGPTLLRLGGVTMRLLHQSELPVVLAPPSL